MKKIFGHRGLPYIYPENTFESINKAFEYCDYVEIDVRLTKDNSLILFHDADIDGSFIKNMTLKEIDEALNNVSIDDITLTSRDQIHGKVNFEIKTDTLDNSGIDIIFQKMLGILDTTDIITSFNWKSIQTFKSLFNCNYGIIFDKEEQIYQAQSLSNHDNDLFFMVHHNLIDNRSFSLPLNQTVLWTVNNEEAFKRYIDMDIYGIVTDIPDTMQLYRK